MDLGIYYVHGVWVMNEAWLEAFPALRELDDPAWCQLMRSARIVAHPVGASLFRAGTACQHSFLMLEGIVRVRKVSENGHEIILYHLKAGQICVLTTSCLLAGTDYFAEAIAETNICTLQIPAEIFHAAVTHSTGFRKFVFSSLSQDMHHLVHLLEEVAFDHISHRLAQHLLDLAGTRESIKSTHYYLAVELGTAREVVSRQLKEFERQGWVCLHRGKIGILNHAALKLLAVHG